MLYCKWKIYTGGIKGRVIMVRADMCFVNFCDFYVRRKVIKRLYSKLSTDNKAIYKYYVYSRRILKEKVCNMIWDFLNAEDDEQLNIYAEKLDTEYSKYV